MSNLLIAVVGGTVAVAIDKGWEMPFTTYLYFLGSILTMAFICLTIYYWLAWR